MYLSSHGFLEAEENGDMENGEEQIFGEIMGIVGDRMGILDLNLMFFFFLPFTPTAIPRFWGWKIGALPCTSSSSCWPSFSWPCSWRRSLGNAGWNASRDASEHW